MPAASHTIYLGRGHKYAAQRCDCGRHASRKEHRRWQELTLLERAGEIRNLREQVVFELAPAVVIGGRKRPPLKYIADFCYEERLPDGTWQQVTEDCKGFVTEGFRIKRHLLAVKGVEVRLT